MNEKMISLAEDPSDISEEPPEPPLPLAIPFVGTEARPCPAVRLRLVKPSFRISAKARNFRLRFFPSAGQADWDDWNWQLANRVTSLDRLGQMLHLTDTETQVFRDRPDAVPLSITPYYASLLDPANPSQALRRCVVPTVFENLLSPGETRDPLGEENDSPVPGLVHRYPDRVLFLATCACSTYCRYCTRSRAVGDACPPSAENWERALDYIRDHAEVRDVLVSGGDPLTLPDDVLDWLLSRISAIPHVEFIRIGTKVPAVMPQRITRALIKVLRGYRPLWISIHATHPDELTPEMGQACGRLADAGIPLGSQTVLLAGINDSLETLKKLYHGLLAMRVRPYYLYQCDPICGSNHFRTSVRKGLEIIQGLRGFTSGYAVPSYVIDAPGGGGKIPLLPDYVIGREEGCLVLRNYEGKVFRYPDKAGE
ncbi:MAG: KamA family radical SAM protein [Spirochaetia bacterium]|jgi:lysine 2,3-aminomutase|nr:KamA family radical SAM protein [Spirochaetia bacterium]